MIFISSNLVEADLNETTNQNIWRIMTTIILHTILELRLISRSEQNFSHKFICFIFFGLTRNLFFRDLGVSSLRPMSMRCFTLNLCFSLL